jgi:mono/diheme cytochrome c family protein
MVKPFPGSLVAGCLATMSVAIVSGQAPPPRPKPAAVRSSRAQAPATTAAAGSVAKPAVAADVSTQRALVDQYCVVCHNGKLKTAGLLLDQLDLAHLGEHAEIGEKVVRKLRAGMMPPSGMPRPDPATREALITWMETELDHHASTNLTPPGIHRLNRTEYSNAIRDLLGLEVDASKFLPSDDSTHGFDNIAGALTMSPALMEAYLSAAGKISRLAIGDVTAPTQAVYTVPEDVTQNYHIEGLPFGTRGGMLIKHEFPADAEYVFKILPVNKGNMAGSSAFGEVKGEQLEVTIDGERVHLFDWDEEVAKGEAVHAGADTERIPIKAGLHTIGVTFLATNYAPGNDLNTQFLRSTIQTGTIPGFTFYPHVGIVRIDGPYDAKGANDTESRRKIFVCHPTGQKDEEACARKIVSTLATRAYRRTATPADVGALMEFYQAGRNDGTFDQGIERAIRRLLADPEFVYRREAQPANVAPGKAYHISDLALASRLSFFLWSSIPDDQLIGLAAQGRLHDPAVLEQQVRRMLADPKSEALVDNFTGQWLNVRSLATDNPTVSLYPDFDDNLRDAFRTEIELFFGSVVHEDRSILDLLTADYTYVNERLAKHYGIPNIYGPQFRRVTLPADLDMRRGLLGKGALMTVTSQPARTSPVARGKWFLQTFLGVSPPDPPPNVPAIKPKADDNGSGNVREPTMRETMEAHHTNPVCATCHRIFEPIGLTLENFDAIGTWRTSVDGRPIDTAGTLVDGTKVDGVASLRGVLVRYQDQFARVVAEKLLTYALGRGVEYQDMPLVRSIVHDAAGSNYRFTSLVMSIVKSAPFQMNTKEAETTQQAAR